MDPAQHRVQELPGRENHVIELQRPVGPPPRADSPKTGSVLRSLPCLSMRFDQKQAVHFAPYPGGMPTSYGRSLTFSSALGTDSPRARSRSAGQSTVTRHCSRPPVCKRMTYQLSSLIM